MTPKPIPTIVSDELFLPVSYAIVRGMDSKYAIRNVTNDGKAQVWIKVIDDNVELGTQLHIHLRLFGCDFWATGELELIDVDFYINKDDLPKALLRALGYKKVNKNGSIAGTRTISDRDRDLLSDPSKPNLP